MDLLRKLVSSPRARHDEANLDLCYVTPNLIATSGPSGTYPQIAYRNPLSQLVKFLDQKHGDNWAIWEFRAEGTGYPDEEVYGRIRHYPWPDHHPPPFALVPLMVASMREWLRGNAERVCVVHCKAGKGRSGTVTCSYLIAEEGWSVEEAMRTFTEKRMRPGFGSGVSIPSQVRWVGYVERWARGGKVYVERQVEVVEVHVWGLRDGVKVAVEGFVEEGKVIRNFHTFQTEEREVVEGVIKKENGFADVAWEMMGKNKKEKEEGGENGIETGTQVKATEQADSNGSKPPPISSAKNQAKTTEKIETFTSAPVTTEQPKPASKPDSNPSAPSSSPDDINTTKQDPTPSHTIFRPQTPIILPTSDINIDFERRNNSKYTGFTMVTSVAHVWFNTYFEGQGPQGGKPNSTGEFEIDFDAMDGIKGSSRKGTRAFDRIKVVWRAVAEKPEVVVEEPKEGDEVPQAKPADWKTNDGRSQDWEKKLGMRERDVESEGVSRASSLRTAETVESKDELEGVRQFGEEVGEKGVEKTNTENGASSLDRDTTTARSGALGTEHSIAGVSNSRVDETSVQRQ